MLLLGLRTVDMHKILRYGGYGGMEVWKYIIVLRTCMTIFHIHIMGWRKDPTVCTADWTKEGSEQDQHFIVQ